MLFLQTCNTVNNFLNNRNFDSHKIAQCLVLILLEIIVTPEIHIIIVKSIPDNRLSWQYVAIGI